MKLTDINPDDFVLEDDIRSQKPLKLTDINPDDFEMEDDPGVLKSALISLNQGLTGGYYDEARGYIKGGIESLKNKTPFTDEYKKARDEARTLHHKAKEYHPRVSAHTEIGGGIATSLIPGMSGVKGASALQRIGTTAGLGAMDALGQSEAPNFSKEQALDAGTGAVIGGGLAGLGEGLGSGIKKAGEKSGPAIKKGGMWSAEKLGIPKGAVDEYAADPKAFNEWVTKAEVNAPSTGNKLNDVLTSPQTRYVQDRVKSKIQPLYDDLAAKESALVTARETHAVAKEAFGEAKESVRRARAENIQKASMDLQASQARLRDEIKAASTLDPDVVVQVDTLFGKVREKNKQAAAMQEKYLKGTDYVEVSKPLSEFENEIEDMISSSDKAKLKSVLSDITAKTDGQYGMNPSEARKARAYVQGLVDWDSVKREGYSDEATRSLQKLQKEMNDAIDDAIDDPTYKTFRAQYADFMRTSEAARDAVGKDYYTGIKSVMSNPDKLRKLKKLEDLLNQTSKDPFSVIGDPKVRAYMKNKYMTDESRRGQFENLPEKKTLDEIKSSNVNNEIRGLSEYDALKKAEMDAAAAKTDVKTTKENIGPVTENNANAMIDRYSRMGNTAKNSGAKEAFSGLGEDLVDDMNKYSVNRAFETSRPNGSRLVNLMSNLVPAPFKPVAALTGAAMDYSGGKIARGVIDVGDMLQKAGPKYGEILRKAFEKGGNKSLAITHTLLMNNYPEYENIMSSP